MNSNKEIVTKAGEKITLLGDQIKIGDKAPNCSLINKDGKEVKLSDFKGKVVVINVYPSIDTPVCALQVKHFNKTASKIGKDVEIIGVSKDLPFALSRFCAAEGIERVTTLSDYKDGDFGIKYGFLIEELMLLARGIIIVDREGVVTYVEYVKDIIDEPDYDNAIEQIRLIYNI